MSTVFASFKHLKLPISIEIHVTTLQIVYFCMTSISQSKKGGKDQESIQSDPGYHMGK